MSDRIVVLGECMLELKPHETASARTEPPMQAQLGFGGDSLNLSVYLARLGISVSYATALGDDAMSDWMVSRWQSEGIDCSLVYREPGGVPGLYLIETDEHGERSFMYWRDNSPARRLLDDSGSTEALFANMSNYPHCYLSGISLALFDEQARNHLFEFLQTYRASGGQVIFDSNYRPGQWPGPDVARAAYERMYTLTDIALPTLGDEGSLFGKEDASLLLQRLQQCGVQEIALKLGAEGCLVANGAEQHKVAAQKIERVVDTTSAGDSFNAGYLSARFDGLGLREAAVMGARVAGLVVQFPGALVPLDDFHERLDLPVPGAS